MTVVRRPRAHPRSAFICIRKTTGFPGIRKRSPAEAQRNPGPSAPAGIRSFLKIHREDRPGEEGSDEAILPRRCGPVEAASKRWSIRNFGNALRRTILRNDSRNVADKRFHQATYDRRPRRWSHRRRERFGSWHAEPGRASRVAGWTGRSLFLPGKHIQKTSNPVTRTGASTRKMRLILRTHAKFLSQFPSRQLPTRNNRNPLRRHKRTRRCHNEPL